MHHVRIIYLLLYPLSIAKLLPFPPLKPTSCFVFQSSRRFLNSNAFSRNCSHPWSNLENDPYFSKNSQFHLLIRDEQVNPSSSTLPPGERLLNYHEKKEVLHKILFERNDRLIKDLISKANPEELVRNRPRAHKEAKKVAKDEELIRVISQEEEAETVEDSGYEEPTQINHVRASNIVFHRGEVYTVVAIQHIAQARAKGHYKAKMRLLHTNKDTSFSFPDACKLIVINPKKVACTYSHLDEATNCHVFKGEKSDINVPRNTNIPSLKYLKPGLGVSISRWKERILNVFVPFHIEYKVVKLNTGNYAATLDNGLVVLVPTYIKVNDHIEITTRAGEFLRRTKIS